MAKKLIKEEWTPFGKPWKIINRFPSYNEADEKRNILLTQWGEGTKMRVKVRRTADGLFSVRIRDDAPPKKNKKRNKKRKGKGNERQSQG